MFNQFKKTISKANEELRERKYLEAIRSFNLALGNNLSKEQKEQALAGLQSAYCGQINQVREDRDTDQEERYLKDYLSLLSSENGSYIENLRCLAHLRQTNYEKRNPQKNHPVKTEKPYRIDNLIFQGGGIKGLAYMGVLQTLPDYIDLNQLTRVGGTSAGAITAALIAVGYTAEEYERIIEKELDFKKLMDGIHREKVLNLVKLEKKSHTSIASIKKSQKASQISSAITTVLSEIGQNHLGLFPGEFFRNELEMHLQRKTGISWLTFRELHDLRKEKSRCFKELCVVGVNLNTARTEVFSFETTPDAIISDAVRISMSIPMLFEPHRLYIKNKHGVRIVDPARESYIYIDGGILDNYPLWLFDKQGYLNENIESIQSTQLADSGEIKSGRDIKFDEYVQNPYTLGFRLVTKERKQAYETHHPMSETPPTQLFSYVWRIFNIIRHKQDSDHIKNQETSRTIYIDYLDVNTVDFDLEEEIKIQLIESGKNAVTDYFNQRYPHENGDFWAILAKGESSDLKKFAKGSYYFNQPNMDNLYPLDIAIEKDNKQLVLKLISYGARRCTESNREKVENFLKEAVNSPFLNQKKLKRYWCDMFQENSPDFSRVGSNSQTLASSELASGIQDTSQLAAQSVINNESENSSDIGRSPV